MSKETRKSLSKSLITDNLDVKFPDFLNDRIEIEKLKDPLTKLRRLSRSFTSNFQDLKQIELGVSNFKSFRDINSIILKPITIFIGPNGSGKSNFIKFIRLLVQTFTSENRENPLVLGGKFIRSASFEDLLYQDTTNTILQSYISAQLKGEKQSKSSKKYITEINLFKKGRKKKIYLEKFKILNIQENNQEELLLEVKLDQENHLQELKGYSKKFNYLFKPELLLEEPQIKKEILNFLDKIKDKKILLNTFSGEILLSLIEEIIIKLMQNIVNIRLEGLFVDINVLLLEFNEEFLAMITKDLEKYYKKLDSKERNKFVNINLRYFDYKTFYSFYNLLNKYKKDKFNSVSYLYLYIKCLFFYHDVIIPFLYNEIESLIKIGKEIDFKYMELTDYFNKFVYIEPVRIQPERFYISSGMTFTEVGHRGEHLAEILETFNKQKLSKVNNWLIRLGLASDIKTMPIARGKNVKQIVVKDSITDLKINLADTAFGFSQILPFIVEGINCSAGSTIITEQPEIHLNPRIQAELGDFLIYLHKKLKVNTIIETHSEHILLRLQRRIAEGEIPPKDIGIYYFELTDKGTQVKKLELNESGQFKEWPKGFFEDDLADAFKLAEAVNNKMQKEKK